MQENNRYIVHKNNTVCTKFSSAETKMYHQFCTMHSSKQVIQCQTYRANKLNGFYMRATLALNGLKVSQKRSL